MSSANAGLQHAIMPAASTLATIFIESPSTIVRHSVGCLPRSPDKQVMRQCRSPMKF
jgi:hypothetical protein